MRNGTHSDSNANPLDSPSTQDPPPHSSPETSHLKRRSTSPLSSHGKKRVKSSHTDTNGRPPSDRSSARDDSEAETVHLSDQGSETSKVKHKSIKKESIDRNRVSSPSLTMRPGLAHSRPGSRESSADKFDRSDKRANGAKAKENGLRNGISRPSGLSKTDALRNEGRTSRAASAEHSANENSEKARSSSAHDRRKRKLSDPLRLSHNEPPRQKLRLDGNLKERRPSPGSYVKSPPISAASLRGHRRSASTQSHIPKPPLSAPLFSSRDNHSSASNDGRDWDSDYSSDEGSSHRTHTIATHPPTSRQAMMALASPAPVGAPHKRTDKFGLTALAKACEKGKLEAVKSAYEIAPDDLDFPDNAGYAPLQKAALYGHADIVEFLLEKGCRIDCRSKNGDTPLIDASENSHTDVLRLLIDHGVNPHHQNEKGLRAIDLVDEDDDDADTHKEMLRKAMKVYEGPESEDEGHLLDLPAPGTNQERKDLLHKEANLKNLLHYAQRGDLQAVDHFLSMKLKPNVECCVVAARGGFEHTLTLLLTDVADKDPDPLEFNETPMLAAIGRGHLKIIRLLLTQNDSVFNPCRKNRDGKYYWQIAEERQGRHWEAERDLLKEYFDKYQAQHGGKSIKKKRILQDSPKHKRVASTSKVESMKAPPVPKLLKSKTTENKTEKSEKVKKDREASNKSEDPPRRKKLMSARDLTVVEGKSRRRRVVEDESSTIESDEDADIRAPVHNPTRRKSSSTSKSSHVKTEESTVISRHKSDKPDQVGRPQTSTPRRTMSRSPVTERRKSIQARATKENYVRSSLEPPAVTVRDISPSLTDDVMHPDASESDDSATVARQQAAAQAEAERKAAELRAQEAEEARKKAAEQQVEEERRQQEAMAAREARLAAVPGALRAAMELGSERPMCHQIVGTDDLYSDPTGVGYQFLPLREWYLADINPSCELERRQEKWILSHQVVGLFGLPELTLDELPDIEKIPVSDEQRPRIVELEDRIERLASYTHIDQGMPDPDYFDRACEKATQQLLKLEPWYFVPLEKVLALLPNYPHLEGYQIAREDQPDLRPRQHPMTKRESEIQAWKHDLRTAAARTSEIRDAQALKVHEVNGIASENHMDGSSQDDVDAEGELEDEQDALMGNA